MIIPPASIKGSFSYFTEVVAHYISYLFQKTFPQIKTNAPNRDRAGVYALPITPASYDMILKEILSQHTEEQKETLIFKEKISF